MYKKGYTVGTFDLFHVGHLNLLKEAKKYCEYLIVGIHSDEWVYQCKKHNTIIPYNERAEIISSIKYVDEIVKNTGLSKIQAWNEYRFNVAFIGDDWKNTEIWTNIEKELNTVGVDVIYIPYTKEISTTYLKKKIASEKI